MQRYGSLARRPQPRRLLNVNSLELQDFDYDGELPAYCTLSHRWYATQEPTLQDWQDGIRDGLGARKIIDFCKYVEQHPTMRWRRNCTWVWVDTICIDKISSAELSEAINAMSSYYEQAQACVVFLSDVHFTQSRAESYEFSDSEWWYRGWTLQELVFSKRVYFLNSSWIEIGHFEGGQQDEPTRKSVSSITGIHQSFLGGNKSVILQASVATRMSWAGKRRCTRIEDEAYCLLGLFNISMPLLYGEGANAFIRLQQQILEQSADETIFAWRMPMQFENDIAQIDKNWLDHLEAVPILADHPDRFHASKDTFPCAVTSRRPYHITNKGLEFETDALEMTLGSETLLVVQLNCCAVFWHSDLALDEDNSVVRQAESCYLVFKKLDDERIVRCMPWGLSWQQTGDTGVITRLIGPRTYFVKTDTVESILTTDVPASRVGWKDTLAKRFQDICDLREMNERGQGLEAQRLHKIEEQAELRNLADKLDSEGNLP